MSASKRRIPIPVLLLAMIVTLVLPARPADAVTISLTITSSSAQFAAGKFGLTGLAQSGGVQLVPLGQLKRWQTPGQELCRPVGNMGTASFGPYIYSIGGTTSSGGVPSNLTEVCRTRVKDTDANFDDWVTLPTENLPEKRTSLAAVAVPRPSNPSLGYLYAFGGLIETATSQSNVIYRTGINADGSLTGWVADQLTLPTAREQLMATAFTNSAGKSFIYVIGGYRKPFALTTAYADVLRYEVAADGSLTNFTQLAPVPLTEEDLPGTSGCPELRGINQADAITFDVATLDQSGSRRFLAVIGGQVQVGSVASGENCTEVSATSARVFMASINETNGNLTWQTGDEYEYTMPQPILNTRAVAVNGKIYAAGGVVNSTSTNIAYSSYIDLATLKLPSFGVSPSSNFLASSTALNQDQRRDSHGLEIVTVDGRPIVFMFGGTGVNSGTFRRDVLYGYIGRPEDFDDTAGGYASPGVYQSPIYQLRAEGQLSQMLWTASISDTGSITTDLKMEYRLAKTTEELAAADWEELDSNPNPAFYSTPGANTATTTLTNTGRFIQYRTLFTTSSPQTRSATPILRGPVSIRYKIDGHPSLYVDPTSTIPTITSGTIIVPNIKIANGLPPGSTSTEKILDADIEGNGTFYVELYAFPPNSTPTRPEPNANGVYPLTSAVFAQIGKTAMTADKNYVIPANSWRQTCPTIPNCPPANWQRIFNRVGAWTVYAVVDTGNNVNEADLKTGAWEIDNNDFMFTVQSQVSGATLFMPIVVRIPAPANR